MKKILVTLLIASSLVVSPMASASSITEQRDHLFYEFTLIFKETVKVSKELPKNPNLQSRYDYLINRLHEIKAEHDQLTGAFL